MFFKKKNNDTKIEIKSDEKIISEQDIEENCLKIAEIISGGGENVMSELRESYANPQIYITKHHEHLLEAYALEEEEMEEFACDKWWLMTDILEMNRYVCKRDWKDELEDFLFFLFETKRALSENIKIDSTDLPFSESGSVPQWSELIDHALADKNLIVGNIDTESDEYTLFLCTVDELKALSEYARSIHQKIAPAKSAV